MNKLTISLTIFALALGGCGDDDRPGDITLMDSGPGGDMGPDITLMDSGPGTDMGGPVGECAQMLPALPADFVPRCSAETLTCAMDCGTDGACQQGCFESDTTPAYMGEAELNCGYCVFYQGAQCADANGCHNEWAALNCCLEGSGCASGDTACFQTACGAEIGAWQSCEPTADCNGPVVSCFEM